MPGANDEWGGLANGELHLASLTLSPAFPVHMPPPTGSAIVLRSSVLVHPGDDKQCVSSVCEW